MQCLAVYLTPTKQGLQPNFQMRYWSARNVCSSLQLRNCGTFQRSRSCLLGLLHHHCTWLPTCVLHNGCVGLFLLLEPQRTLAYRFFAVLPLLQASPSEHLRLSPFPISSDPNLDFFFPLQEMIIDKVNGQPVPRYLIYDIIKFNVSSATKECTVALWDIQLPQVTVWFHSLSFDKGIFCGHWKFFWFCQGKSLYSHLCLSPSKTILNQVHSSMKRPLNMNARV